MANIFVDEELPYATIASIFEAAVTIWIYGTKAGTKTKEYFDVIFEKLERSLSQVLGKSVKIADTGRRITIAKYVVRYFLYTKISGDLRSMERSAFEAYNNILKERLLGSESGSAQEWVVNKILSIFDLDYADLDGKSRATLVNEVIETASTLIDFVPLVVEATTLGIYREETGLWSRLDPDHRIGKPNSGELEFVSWFRVLISPAKIEDGLMAFTIEKGRVVTAEVL